MTYYWVFVRTNGGKVLEELKTTSYDEAAEFYQCKLREHISAGLQQPTGYVQMVSYSNGQVWSELKNSLILQLTK